MNRTLARLLCAIAAFASVAANAQLFRAYLAPNGSDSNACTLAAPCRLLPTALAAVADGGEVWILDSGNYNTAPVNVTKSVTILAVPGAVGSVVATNGNAFDIGTPGVNVVLRNLVMVPLPNGAAVSGVSVTAAASVIIDNCLIANMPNYGVTVVPTTSVKVRIDNSTIRGAGTNNLVGGVPYGIWVTPVGANTTTTVDVANTSVDGNVGGIIFTASGTAVIKAGVRDSRVRQNSDNGIAVQGPATVAVSHNMISDNSLNAIIVFTGGKVWVSGNTVHNNATGLRMAGGVIESAVNNEVRNNAGNDILGGSVVAVGMN